MNIRDSQVVVAWMRLHRMLTDVTAGTFMRSLARLRGNAAASAKAPCPACGPAPCRCADRVPRRAQRDPFEQEAYEGPDGSQAKAYELIVDELKKGMSFRCSGEKSAVCQAGKTWTHGQGDDVGLVICPDAWRGLVCRDRVAGIDMMAAAIGHFHGPGSEADWYRYAVDAEAMTAEKFPES